MIFTSVKLLFDQDLSRRIVSVLCKVYPDSSQVQLLGMENTSDKDIRALESRG